jgi:peptide deformylase
MQLLELYLEEIDVSSNIEDPKIEEYYENLVHVGDPILRRPCATVKDFKEAQERVTLLTAVVRGIQGAGLAANQYGLDMQIAVAEVRKTALFPDRPEHHLVVLINPEILFYSKVTELDWEGCFSIPGYLGYVPRSTKIVVRNHTLNGETREETYDGYIARVIQHECDHLQGRVYLDRMESMEKFVTRKNYQRFIKKIEPPPEIVAT